MIEFWQVSAPQHSSEAAPLSCCSSCCNADMKCAWKSEKLCCTSRNWIHCKAQRLTEKGICFNFYSLLLLLEAEAFIWVDSVSRSKGGRLQIFLLANSQTLAWAFSPGLAEAGADWAQVDLHHQLQKGASFFTCPAVLESLQFSTLSTAGGTWRFLWVDI